MYIKNITALAVLVACVAAIPAPPTHAIHEKRDANPNRWIKRAKTPRAAVLPVRIGLKQRNLDNGDAMLMDVADPASPNYAKHWTPEQVVEHFSPSDETVEAVKEWLHNSGINPGRIAHSDNKGWLAFDATTAEMENLLHTKYYAYEHAQHGHTATSCDKYHVPKDIQHHIDYITPGVKLLAPMKRGQKKEFKKNSKRTFGVSKPGKNTPILFNENLPNLGSDVNDTTTCDKAITPACVAALYQIPPGNSSRPDNAMAVYEEGDYFAQSDLDKASAWNSFCEREQ
jgi:tripeptidyl-peptidase I